MSTLSYDEVLSTPRVSNPGLGQKLIRTPPPNTGVNVVRFQHAPPSHPLPFTSPPHASQHTLQFTSSGG